MILEVLQDVDRQLLLAVNGSDSLFLDRLASSLTHGATWIPLYLALFYMVMKNNDNFRRLLYVLCGVALCYLLAGAVDDGIIKPLVARWRPTHDPEIGTLVDIVDGYRGGKYGFFSAHASNTMSIATFFCWLARSRRLSVMLVCWSLVNCWTRLYLGVHFPGDILVGLIWGFTVATGVYFLYRRLTRGMYTPRNLNPAQYTSTCYRRQDCNWPVAIFVFTLTFVFIKVCIL
ncbi:phosphatase PAP2 family protein [Xylanibacter ruminicola]|uniref:Undecaprenyl-diphosphatase n=1 Tax=Xylanibacter ruminicola TaxID=839 RepID=A0A1M6W6P3_XYLRU|nr:phosphatase PAP2 family protein [Xylanibacter ruminicola]SHK89357.1 undecaprenyl-diphosphatase [Xylanibacter ruminicola]